MSAIWSAVALFLDVFGIALFFLLGGFPGRDQVVVCALGIMLNFEDHGTELTATPSDCAKLFRVVTLLVNHIHLVEYLLGLFQADAMFALDIQTLPRIELEAHCFI